MESSYSWHDSIHDSVQLDYVHYMTSDTGGESSFEENAHDTIR